MSTANLMEYRKAFQKLWVVGASGAFFIALVRTIPIDIEHIAFPSDRWPPTFDYTLDRAIRYAYLLWLLAYFFISATNNEIENKENAKSPSGRDIWFDVIQTVFSFNAAFFLGFILPGKHDNFNDFPCAYAWASVAICVISALSYLMFGKSTQLAERTVINCLRRLGFCFAYISLLLSISLKFYSTFLGISESSALWTFVGLLLFLWVILGMYFLKRLAKTPAPDKVVALETRTTKLETKTNTLVTETAALEARTTALEANVAPKTVKEAAVVAVVPDVPKN